jgi:hypothetical protein
MLLLRRPEKCDEAEHKARAELGDVHPEVGIAVCFTERFVEIVQERRGTELGRWLSDAEASGVREIRQFAYKVRRDEAAVKAGCTLPWSNGQTEGQITKLKAIKRRMYGRAKFDLLASGRCTQHDYRAHQNLGRANRLGRNVPWRKDLSSHEYGV